MVHHYDGPDNKATSELIEEKEKEIKLLEKEKEQIIKDDQIKNQKALDLSEKLKKLKELRDQTESQIIDTTLELNKHCTHERIRTKNRSYPGGYLDRAEYWTNYFCEICGAKVDEKVEYGSFG
jgi:hypothetical protein